MTLPPEPDTTGRSRRPGLMARARSNFLAGLVIIAPIGLTFWLIYTVVGWVDSWVWPFVPGRYRPTALTDRWFGEGTAEMIPIDVQGVGVVIFLLFTVLVGWLGKGFIGRAVIRSGERLVNRTPVVRSVYGGVKQIAETVFSQRDTTFEQACLVEFPRKGIWRIAFISTAARGEIAEKLPQDSDLATVFMPNTPNPTAGFLMFLPRADLIILDMSVEDAAKLVISAGLVYPNPRDPSQPTTTP